MIYLNIGTFGHVDHGKSTLTRALTGKITDTHSEEIKRGITIRLGHADFIIYKKGDQYFLKQVEGAEAVKRVFIVDAPGHESLMATAISASSIVDGAILVIAANEPCPQPQTREHLAVLQMLGIKNIVIVQTKIDAVSKEQALKNFKEIKEFVKGTVAENAPIIPVSSTYKINLEYILRELDKFEPQEKSLDYDNLAFTIRSFDVNKPGTPVQKMVGGVLGGSVITGSFKVGDEIEIKPGVPVENTYKPIYTKVTSLHLEGEPLEEAKKGGLIAFGTELDPAIARSDALAGNIIGKKGTLPEPVRVIKLKFKFMKRDDIPEVPLKQGEPLLLNFYSVTTVGVINQLGKGIATVVLKKPIVPIDNKIAVSRRIGNRWRFAGIGEIMF